MKKNFLFVAVVSLFTSMFSMGLNAAVKTETIDYQEGNTKLEGYLAYDDAKKGKLPVVLIVHEWKGLGDYEKRRAKEIANLGYIGFAIDIYGKGIRPKTDEEAGKTAGIYKSNRALMQKRAAAAFEALKKIPNADTSKTAAIGFCFGGTTSLEIARAAMPIRAAVSFHGGLDSPTKLKKGSNVQVLVLHGADDKMVPQKDIDSLKQEMKEAGVKFEFISYPGAVHGFSKIEAGLNTGSGYAYNETADKNSQEAMKAWLKEAFKS